MGIFEGIEDVPVCAYCKVGMIVRQGPNGKFYGCSNFPECRETEEHPENPDPRREYDAHYYDHEDRPVFDDEWGTL